MQNDFHHSPADTFLLAAFGRRHWPHRREPCRVLDLGCGPGRLLYEIAKERPRTELYGLELQPAPLEQAAEALAAQGMQVRRMSKIEPCGKGEAAIRLVQGDLRRMESLGPPDSFDVVFINPPYFPRGAGRLPPDPIRARYRHEMDATLEHFLRAAEYVLAPTGVVLVIYPHARMKHFEAVLGSTRLRMAARQDVFPHRDATQAYWTLCCLALAEHCNRTQRLKPVRDPDTFMGFDREQEEIATG